MWTSFVKAGIYYSSYGIKYTVLFFFLQSVSHWCVSANVSVCWSQHCNFIRDVVASNRDDTLNECQILCWSQGSGVWQNVDYRNSVQLEASQCVCPHLWNIGLTRPLSPSLEGLSDNTCGTMRDVIRVLCSTHYLLCNQASFCRHQQTSGHCLCT